MRLVHAPLTLRVCEQRAPAVRVAIFFPLRPSVCRWLCPSAAPPPRLPATGSARSRPPPAGPGPGEPGPAGPKLQPGAHCPAVRLSGGGAQGAGALESAEAPGKETPPPTTTTTTASFLRGPAGDAGAPRQPVGRRLSVLLSVSGEGPAWAAGTARLSRPRGRAPAAAPCVPRRSRVRSASAPPRSRVGPAPPPAGPGPPWARAPRCRDGPASDRLGWSWGRGAWAWERWARGAAAPARTRARQFRFSLRVCRSRLGGPTSGSCLIPGDLFTWLELGKSQGTSPLQSWPEGPGERRAAA